MAHATIFGNRMRRGLLLDRDGVINIDHGYVGRREQFEFMPGLLPFLQAAQDRGFRLAILTNQSGVARGLYSEADFEQLTAWMLDEFRRQGIVIDLTLSCFEHPEGSAAAYTRESYWRKPNPGMVIEAVQHLRLDPQRSVFLGDNMRDMDAAKAGGIKHCLMLTTQQTQGQGIVVVHDFSEAFSALNSFV